MPRLILHEHPSQRGGCLPSMVKYAKRIPTRFATVEDAAQYLRAQPYRADDGLDNSAVPVPDYQFSGCRPWQRERVWPKDFNCWEATAHWLAHALKQFSGDEEVHIYDRDITPNSRHVWPVVKRNNEVWLVILDSDRYIGNMSPSRAANLGWEDIFKAENVVGLIHSVGAGALGYFLGPLASPIVEKAEELWDRNLPDWARSKSTKQLAKLAVEKVAKASEEASQKTDEKADSNKPTFITKARASLMKWTDV